MFQFGFINFLSKIRPLNNVHNNISHFKTCIMLFIFYLINGKYLKLK